MLWEIFFVVWPQEATWNENHNFRAFLNLDLMQRETDGQIIHLTSDICTQLQSYWRKNVGNEVWAEGRWI